MLRTLTDWMREAQYRIRIDRKIGSLDFICDRPMQSNAAFRAGTAQPRQASDRDLPSPDWLPPVACSFRSQPVAVNSAATHPVG